MGGRPIVLTRILRNRFTRTRTPSRFHIGLRRNYIILYLYFSYIAVPIFSMISFVVWLRLKDFGHERYKDYKTPTIVRVYNARTRPYALVPLVMSHLFFISTAHYTIIIYCVFKNIIYHHIILSCDIYVYSYYFKVTKIISTLLRSCSRIVYIYFFIFFIDFEILKRHKSY